MITRKFQLLDSSTSESEAAADDIEVSGNAKVEESSSTPQELPPISAGATGPVKEFQIRRLAIETTDDAVTTSSTRESSSVSSSIDLDVPNPPPPLLEKPFTAASAVVPTSTVLVSPTESADDVHLSLGCLTPARHDEEQKRCIETTFSPTDGQTTSATALGGGGNPAAEQLWPVDDVPPVVVAATSNTIHDQAVRETESPNLSTGVEYTVVPKWQQKMVKRNGVYIPMKSDAPGIGIYERGMKSLERKSVRLEMLRTRLQEEEEHEATFHPSISRRAKALRNADHGTSEPHGSAAQLRYRLQLLELPDTEMPPTRRTPRISRNSERMVKAHRAQAGATLPPSERLYRDHFYRKEAAPPELMIASQTIVRTQSEIEEHISSLYAYEANRQQAMAAVRETAFLGASDKQVYVDPAAVVERLTKRPPQRRRAMSSNDAFSFRPQRNPSIANHISQGRRRGLQRWVATFGGDTQLEMSSLRGYTGPDIPEAHVMEQVLRTSDPARTLWDVDDIIAAFADAEQRGVEEIWRRRPSKVESVTLHDLTFRPSVNYRSTVIVDNKEEKMRCGATHDRLFLSAKAKQLSIKQQELEKEQLALETEHRRYEKRQKMYAQWRDEGKQKLEAYHQDRTQSAPKALAIAAPVPASEPPQQAGLRGRPRLSVPPSVSPAPTTSAASSSPSRKPAGKSHERCENSQAAEASSNNRASRNPPREEGCALLVSASQSMAQLRATVSPLRIKDTLECQPFTEDLIVSPAIRYHEEVVTYADSVQLPMPESRSTARGGPVKSVAKRALRGGHSSTNIDQQESWERANNRRIRDLGRLLNSRSKQ